MFLWLKKTAESCHIYIGTQLAPDWNPAVPVALQGLPVGAQFVGLAAVLQFKASATERRYKVDLTPQINGGIGRKKEECTNKANLC